MRHVDQIEPQETDRYYPSQEDLAEMAEITAELDRIDAEREAERDALNEWNYHMNMVGN